jgi:hypothetical protein
MSISSSVYTTGHIQQDGRRYVQEVHIDHLSVKHIFEYLWDGVSDRDVTLAQRASKLLQSLAAAEYASRVAIDGWSGTLQHQTAAQFADKLRAEYRISTRQRVCYLAWWLIRRINAGDFTDVQVRNAFGMTTQQYTTFKTNKLVPFHDHWVAVLAAEGE